MYTTTRRNREDFKRRFYCSDSSCRSCPAITAFQGGEITMTYRDANGNMSSTIVREENKSKMATLLVLLQVKCNELVTSTSFQGYEANRDYSYI
jgi:L-lactate utilization protein LutB